MTGLGPAIVAAALLLGLADDPPIAEETSFSWSAPPWCPQQDHVLGLAERMLLTDTWRVPAHVRGSIEKRDLAYELVLELSDADPRSHESRVLVDTDCSALAETAAIVIALGGSRERKRRLDSTTPISTPDAIVIPPPPTAKPEPDAIDTPLPAPTQPAVARTRDEVPSVRASAAAPRQRSIGLHVSLGGGVGALPSVGGGLLVGGQFTEPRWSIEADARIWRPRTRSASDGSDRHGDFGLVASAIAGCWRTERGRLSLPLCAGPVVGLLSGVGRGEQLDNPQRNIRPWVSLRGSIGIRVRVAGPVAIRADAETVVALVRPGFEIVETGERIHRADGLGARLWAGVESRFAIRRPG